MNIRHYTHLSTVLGIMLSFISIACHAQGQLYKWVGPDGKIVYSDTPPPANVKIVEKKGYIAGSSSTPLPYELANAAAKNPVVLYTAPNCSPCDDARIFLKGLGVPFAEKTIKTAEDLSLLKKSVATPNCPWF